MPIQEFPDPNLADEDGVLAVGGDLSPDSLRLAYRSGIFPWPMSGMDTVWFSPPERAIIYTDQLKLPSNFTKIFKKSIGTSQLRVTLNHDFAAVIEACAKVKRPEQRGTWITKSLKNAYLELFDEQNAFSIEIWSNELLVGGLYGVQVDGLISAESMFFKVSGASKLAVSALNYLLIQNKIKWFDIQVKTPHMMQMGACLIPRSQFLELLRSSLRPASKASLLPLSQKLVLNPEFLF